MLDIRQDIFTLDTGYLRPAFAASHLIVENGRAALVDVGTGHSVPYLLKALAEHGIAPDQVDYLLVTHIHLDHAGGAGALLRALPRARLVVHPRGAPHMLDPSKLIAGASAVYGADEMWRLFGDILPVPRDRIIEAPDRFTVELAGRPLACLDTPGHARHHYCVWDEASYSVFSGDMCGLSYREFDTAQGAFVVPATTPVQFEPAAMHRSLDRLMNLSPRQFYLTHYGCLTQPERAADRLHRWIDAFTGLTAQAARHPDKRHAWLMQALAELLIDDLRRHGCALSTEECLTLLAPDLELNTQGLLVWWDKQHG